MHDAGTAVSMPSYQTERPREMKLDKGDIWLDDVKAPKVQSK